MLYPGVHRLHQVLLVTMCSLVLASTPTKTAHPVNPRSCSIASYSHVSSFYQEKKNSIEMLVIGDSNIYRGFSPMEFWRDTKVTSYALASASQPAWVTYYVLQSALHYQKPKVVVFEINELFASPKGQTGRYCRTINAIKPSMTRLHAIKDPSGGFTKQDRTTLYYAYAHTILHSTLQKISSMPFKEEKKAPKKKKLPNYKGYLMNTSTVPFIGYQTYMQQYKPNLQINKDNEEYIDRIIALCKKHHIPLLFAKFPTQQWSLQKSELAKRFAKKRHIPLYDMNVNNIGIDWMKDTKDGGDHMNDQGAKVATKALESFLAQQIHLTPTKDASVIASYNASLVRYEQDEKEIFSIDKQ